MNENTNRIELLAPAGNMDALHAAVCAGADAVYLGLDHFNARRGADNFTIKNLREACRYAHLRNVKVYITLNIIVFENEVARALQMAADAYNAGADGFIVQDIGIARLVHNQIPAARLHVSTQMNIHNMQGIDAAAALGAKRVTLSRELSIDEISHLSMYANSLNIETETFCHGAICVSYSGQCMMSSMIGGRSANRGTCAQACRLNYEYKSGNWNKGQKKFPEDEKRGSFLLSPKDYCTASILPKLINAGVKSLKIEGRMKSADYVYSVVGVYRKIIDRYYQEKDSKPTADEQLCLSQAFSRGFTTAYMTGTRSNDMMSTTRPNNRGVNIGRVQFANKNKVIIKSSVKLSLGDVLEIWTGKGRAVFVVDKTSNITKSSSKNAICEVTLAVNPNKREQAFVSKSDRVFRTRNSASSFIADQNEPKIMIEGNIKMQLDKPIELTVWPKSNYDKQVVVLGPIVEKARTKEINASEVEQHIKRTGNTDFCFEKLNIKLDRGVGIGFSDLHKLRTEALNKLEQRLLGNWEKIQVKRQNSKTDNKQIENIKLFAIATNPICARAAKRTGAEAVYVPVLNYKRGMAQITGCRMDSSSIGYPRNTILMLPTINHSSDQISRESNLNFSTNQIIDDIKPLKVFVDSIGDAFYAYQNNIDIEIGPHLPAVNNDTLKVLNAFNCSKIWLSPELSIEQIRNLNNNDIEFGLTIFGRQELMITEHCMLMNEGPCAEKCIDCPRRSKPAFLIDRKGYKFPIVSDALGRTHIYNSICLDVCHSIPELIEAGICNFMVDTTLLNEEETCQAVGRASKAISLAQNKESLKKQASFTTGHLFREVE